MEKTKVIEHFLEYKKETNQTCRHFFDSQLPDVPLNIPEVRIVKSKFEQFRNDYTALLNFAACILKKDPKEVNINEIINYFRKEEQEEREKREERR